MAEKITVRMNNRLQVEYLALNPRDPDAREPKPVEQMERLSPYGLLLCGLGACTAMVMMTYANNHDVKLEAVELDLSYNRVFKEDCENCEKIDRYEEHIHEQIRLSGALDEAARQKVYGVAKFCPIHRMLDDGAVIDSHLVE